MYVDPSGEGIFFIIIMVAAALVISANIAAIISSEIMVNESNAEIMGDEEYQTIKDSGTTYGMTMGKRISYIRRVRADNENLFRNWSEADMLREMVYHDEALDIFTFFGSDPNNTKSKAHQAKWVDFESKQNFKTYFRRFIGNLAPW